MAPDAGIRSSSAVQSSERMQDAYHCGCLKPVCDKSMGMTDKALNTAMEFSQRIKVELSRKSKRPSACCVIA